MPAISILRFTAVLGLILLFPLSARASTKHFYRISYRDSLLLEDESHILSGSIVLKNVHIKTISMGVAISFPRYWKQIGRNNAEELSAFFLKSGEKKTIPISLLHNKKVHAGWDSIKIKVWSYYVTDTSVYWIRIHVNEKPQFQIQALNDVQEFSRSNPGNVPLLLKLKNTGNTPDMYSIHGENTRLNFLVNASASLLPGEDTILNIPCRVKERDWRLVNLELVPVIIKSSKIAEAKSGYFKLKQVSSMVSAPLPPRKEIPITIGGGLMLNGDKMQYFGQFRVHYAFGQHIIGFGYRTQDFGTIAYTYQANAFNFNYRYKSIQINAGQIQGPSNFYTFGQGLELQYNRKKTLISLAGIKHNEASSINNNRAYQNDNIFARVKYPLGKLMLYHRLESNHNTYYELRSYLSDNEMHVPLARNGSLRLYAGIGYEEKIRDIANSEKSTTGWSGGYELSSNWKKWMLISNIRYRSKDYPGNFRGQHNQYHELRRQFDGYYLNTSFFLNAIEQNALRDTLYNSDYLSANSIKYGIGVGSEARRIKPFLGIGWLLQTGTQYSFGKAAYVDAVIRYNISTQAMMEFRSNNAIVAQSNVPFCTNSQLQMNSSHWGLYGQYNRTLQPGDNLSNINETVNAGPNINYSFFKNRLQCSFRYQVAKTLSEDVLRHGVGAQLNYAGKNNGVMLGINGFYPLKSPVRTDLPISETRTANVFLLKRINVPLAKQKLYSLKITLFKDSNNNHAMDADEQPLQNVFLTVNDESLITDEEGSARYRQLSPGIFRIRFLNTKLHKLIPADGVEQAIDLQQNESVYIPFLEGKELRGNIRVINDSLSRNAITPDNFKIIIQDTSGHLYYSLSDQNGNFTSYLPSGLYRVSLNQEVFQGTDFIPQKMSYDVRLLEEGQAFVQFTIIQKKRKIRFLNSDNSGERTK